MSPTHIASRSIKHFASFSPVHPENPVKNASSLVIPPFRVSAPSWEPPLLSRVLLFGQNFQILENLQGLEKGIFTVLPEEGRLCPPPKPSAPP